VVHNAVLVAIVDRLDHLVHQPSDLQAQAQSTEHTEILEEERHRTEGKIHTSLYVSDASLCSM